MRRLALMVLAAICGRELAIVATRASLPAATLQRSASTPLPPRLGDREFWRLSEELSEARAGVETANLVSNELRFQQVIPELTRMVPPGRAFIGVGPEQNFTYIAALKPSIAFILDIRRGNRDLHLLYKALFDLAADRAEFVSLLFSRPRPWRLRATSTAGDIFRAYATAFPTWRLHNDTLAAIRHQLLTVHGYGVSAEELQAIEEVHRAFYVIGPGIRYGAHAPPPFPTPPGDVASPHWGLPGNLNGARDQPTFADLMTATDGQGVARGFLASEEAFAVVKDLETRNLIVPVVGDFAGPKAIRAVGAYLKRRSAVVSAFYFSNVEEYLRRAGIWRDFCANLSTLPLDDSSAFIRSESPPKGPVTGLQMEVGRMTSVVQCAPKP